MRDEGEVNYMSKEKLLPCPFCGSEADIVINKTRQGQTSNITCTKCSCRNLIKISVL